MTMLRHFPVVLVLAGIGFAACPPTAAQENCPLPRHEYCDAFKGSTEFGNCLVRNRREDDRYQQCLNEERREQERERQERKKERQEQERERREQEHEKYCRQYPDADSCK
jgi:hypothetical protein